jgi:small subunit ribosomal protein S17
MTGASSTVHGKRKTKVGRVVSDRMDKTIVVSVERLARHPLYKRVIRLTTKFKAHDETNDARIGDTVLIEESRPLSATKRWRLVSIIQRAGEHGLPGETVVGEEAAVTEAIHAAAHPGRTRAADSGSEGDTAAQSDSPETEPEAEPAEAVAAGSRSEDRAVASRSEDRGDAPVSHRSEDSEDSTQ